MVDPVDPQTTDRPGLLLLVSDEYCLFCGAPKVYAEPTRGLREPFRLPQSDLTCMNAPCPAALGAAPLLQALRKALKAMKR